MGQINPTQWWETLQLFDITTFDALQLCAIYCEDFMIIF